MTMSCHRLAPMNVQLCFQVLLVAVGGVAGSLRLRLSTWLVTQLRDPELTLSSLISLMHGWKSWLRGLLGCSIWAHLGSRGQLRPCSITHKPSTRGCGTACRWQCLSIYSKKCLVWELVIVATVTNALKTPWPPHLLALLLPFPRSCSCGFQTCLPCYCRTLCCC
ncbi:hypothetical protein V8C86DRAFT_2941234 [Haematococcus lacustris]